MDGEDGVERPEDDDLFLIPPTPSGARGRGGVISGEDVEELELPSHETRDVHIRGQIGIDCGGLRLKIVAKHGLFDEELTLFPAIIILQKTSKVNGPIHKPDLGRS